MMKSMFAIGVFAGLLSVVGSPATYAGVAPDKTDCRTLVYPQAGNVPFVTCVPMIKGTSHDLKKVIVPVTVPAN